MVVNMSSSKSSSKNISGRLAVLTALALMTTPGALAIPAGPNAEILTGNQAKRNLDVPESDVCSRTTGKLGSKTKEATDIAKDSGAKDSGAKESSKDSVKDSKDNKETTKAGEKQPEKTAEKKESKPAPEPVIENVVTVQPELLVDHPGEYLNKNVRFVANFYAYSTLALDYKPALRPSKNYLSFLILRNNSKVPLSELKLAMPMPKDEKDPQSKLLTELKEGDQLEVTAKVFAVALDEPWADVLRLKRLKAAQDDKKDKGETAPSK